MTPKWHTIAGLCIAKVWGDDIYTFFLFFHNITGRDN